MNARSIVRYLYRLARLANDVTTLASGDPRRIGRRLRNKMLGRLFWRMIR